ncbi:MAG: nuclear transport factor 2 family protein [Acetobacteraceae bacterium]|nr:nuclear transport factor 2 family protein [Acetobacteraceae bacterium]
MTVSAAFDALAEGDAASLARVLLHRCRLEDGLAEAVGRPAVVAALMVGGSLASDMKLAGSGWCFLRLKGDAERHLWAVMEAERAVELTFVTGRTDGWDGAEAERIGAACPTHRPLGELRSGGGQLAAPADDPAAPIALRLLTLINARSLDGRLHLPDARWTGPDGAAGTALERQRWWRKLLAKVADAWLTPVASLAEGECIALRWQLQGHLDGRRVSLPGSTLLRQADGRIAEERTAFDLLALAATAHRPFFPD